MKPTRRAWLPWALGGLALAAVVVLVAVSRVPVVDHDAQRTVEWERLPEGAQAARVEAERVPERLRADLARAGVGDRGFTTLPRAEADAFFQAVEAAGAPLVDGAYAVEVDGRPFAVRRGPVP